MSEPAALPADHPAHYDARNGAYFMSNRRGEWIKVSDSAIKTVLMMNGTSGTVKDANGLTAVDRALHAIRTERDVSFAGRLAGWPVGHHVVCGQRLLVTHGPILPVSSPGAWPVIGRLLAELFGSDPVHGPTQYAVVIGWLRSAWIGLQTGLATGSFGPGQALCVAGDAGCGKSVFQQVVTKLLGGRSADPSRYLCGRTDFNEDLMGCEHLPIEDTASAKDWKSRSEFGQNIKNFLVNHTHSLHGKGKQAITVQRYCRVSISLNKQPEDMMVLPPMTKGVEDKFILTMAGQAALPSPDDREGIRAFWEAVNLELPHFADALEAHELAEGLRNARYAVASWHHPAMVAMLEDLNPYLRLLELIDHARPWDELMVVDGVPQTLEREFWKGTAADLEAVLMEKAPERARRLLRGSMSTGRDLRALHEKHPNRVETYESQGRTIWRVFPAERP